MLTDARSAVRGVSFLVLGMFIFSLQDIAIKWIGGDFPIMEIVILRGIVAVPCTLLFLRLEGQRGQPTQMAGEQLPSAPAIDSSKR